MSQKISCVIITFNEVRILKETLNRVKWCDELIVVDSGSTDGTQPLAVSFGAKVINQPFLGYGLQKGFAVNQASHDWILSIDADEHVTPMLEQEIKNILKSNSEISAYQIPITLFFLKKKITYWFGDTHSPVRLFKKSRGNFNSSHIHEKVEISGKIATLKGEIEHHSYRNVFHYFEKFNLYTSKASEELFQKGKRPPGLSELFLRFQFKFFVLYVVRGGFCNGMPGLAWCLFSALYPVVKYLKLKELYAESMEAKTQSILSQ